MVAKAEPKVYILRHPLHEADAPPVSALVLDYWHESGRLIGLKLQFAGGHTAHLTFDEIRELQETAVSPAPTNGNGHITE